MQVPEPYRAALSSPMQQLRTRLEACRLSSLEIERRTGVPASNVRSIRNGQAGAVRCDTWGPLMLFLLENEGKA